MTSAVIDPGLLGRDRELDELGALLTRARLVTLTGPAGVGKSRLARALAADERWAACTAADLADAGDPEAAGEAIRAAAARLPATAGSRLLLLDNCDLVLGVVASSASRLMAGQQELRIVVTSRESLGASEETVYQVPPLAYPDAAIFFAVRAGAQHGGVVPAITSEIKEICARLDGLPLALELATAHTNVLTSAQILARLDDAMRLLVGGPRSGAARHRSLRGALDWGAGALAPQERVLLRRLSVFADAFTLDCVERVCSGAGLGEDEVLGALAGLVAKSFVHCDPTGAQARYGLMSVVRQYAGQMLAASGEAELMQRNRVTYAIGHPEMLSAADLAEALQSCAEAGAPADGLRLAAAAAPFWLLSGRIRQGATLLADAVGGADSRGGSPQDGAAYTRAVLARGMLECALGRSDEAAAAARLAAARCKRDAGGTEWLWAEVLAGAAMLQTEPQPAARRIARAAAQLPAAAPWTAAATAIYALAAAEAGRMTEAADAAAQALAGARTSSLPAALIAALLASGRVARKQGRLDAAAAALGEAEALAADVHASGALAEILAESCRLALDRGSDDGEPGAQRLERAVALAAEADSPLLLGAALDVAGRSGLRHGHGPAAQSAFARATALSSETGSVQAAAGILGLGQVALAAGSASAAWTLIEEAHAIASTGSGPALLSRTLQAVGDCAWALGNASRAWAAYHRALGLRIDAGLCVSAVESLESLAALALEQGRVEYGVRLLGAAEALRKAQGTTRATPAQQRFEVAVADAMACMAPERYAQLRAEGMRLSLPEAAAYACRQRAPRQRGVGWVSLTATERQVADLAATGLTNREIGQHLFTSPRTVQAHLSHVFAKLGISSRRMLAAEIQARNNQLPLRAPNPGT